MILNEKEGENVSHINTSFSDKLYSSLVKLQMTSINTVYTDVSIMHKWLITNLSEDSIPLEDDEDVNTEILQILNDIASHQYISTEDNITYIKKKVYDIDNFDRWDPETMVKFTEFITKKYLK